MWFQTCIAVPVHIIPCHRGTINLTLRKRKRPYLAWFWSLQVHANPQMKNTTNMLILNLAVADLLFICICVPFTASDYVLMYWPFGLFWWVAHIWAWQLWQIWLGTYMCFFIIDAMKGPFGLSWWVAHIYEPGTAVCPHSIHDYMFLYHRYHRGIDNSHNRYHNM